MKKIFLILSLLPISSLAATSFYKCNVKGITVYSEKACSKNAVKSATEDVYLGKKLKGKSKTADQQLQNFLNSKTKETRKNSKQRSKVGACDDISFLTLRNAAIKDQLMKCHSEKDVISIYGAPSHTRIYSESSYYNKRWKYKFDFNKGFLYVYFKNGLVTKWTQHN